MDCYQLQLFLIFQKLHNCLTIANQTLFHSSACNILLSAGALPVIFVFYSKDLLKSFKDFVLLLFILLPPASLFSFATSFSSSLYNNSTNSWCHRIIATIFKQIIPGYSNIKIFCLIFDMHDLNAALILKVRFHSFR